MASDLPASAPTWRVKTARFGGWTIFIGLVLALLSGPLNRFGIMAAIPALLILGVGLLLLIIGLLAAIVGLLVANSRRLGFAKGRIALGIVAALATIGYLLSVLAGSRGAPPIHEITTDFESPPEFVAVRDVRAKLSKVNPIEYVAEMQNPRGGTIKVAELQRQAYPDLTTVQMAQTPDQVFKQAEAAVRKLGWEIVAAVPVAGRIEATDTTTFFGFKDDIVIRIRVDGTGSRVDARSKSRVGLGDAGANAKRLRRFFELLKAS
jgi:hypothetical protein